MTRNSMQSSTGSYTFTTPPRAVSGRNRKKYRDPNEAISEDPLKPLGNIMTDPRVKRGTTVSATPGILSYSIIIIPL